MAATLSIPLACPPALAWGCKGHQTVALIAQSHFTPHARAQVAKLLGGFSVDPGLRRFCDSAGLPPIADLSTWADDVRSERKETAPWHFIDIPRSFSTNTPYSLDQFCPSGCVTRAIRDQLTVLGDAGASPRARAEALLFVIHFVGDLHQPLHCTSNNDEGGNCLPVAYFDQSPVLANPDTGSFRPNLHGVWDTSVLERVANGTAVAQFAQSLDRRFAPQARRWQQAPIDLDAWALESHRLAEEFSYGRLPKAVPTEPARDVRTCNDDDRVSQRLLALDERLGDAYQGAVAQVVEEQLAKAGVRLAMVLNRLWP